MKKDLHHLDKWRTQHPPYLSPQGATYGAFVIPHQGFHLRIIAADGLGETGPWEHVSCHAYDPHFNKARCPNWNEMCHIASLFWDDDEVIMQLRPAKS